MAEKFQYVSLIHLEHSEITPGPDSKYALVDQNGAVVGIPRPRRTRKTETLPYLAAGESYTFSQTVPTLEPAINPPDGKIKFIPGKQQHSFTGELIQIHDGRFTTQDGDSIFIAELKTRIGVAFFAFALNHFTVSCPRSK